MIADLGKLKAWANPKMDSLRDEELERVLTVASTWLQAVTGRDIEQATYTERFSGDLAEGWARDTILLHPGRRPVTYPDGGTFAVTEDGATLTHAEGYSAAADVLVEAANDADRRCKLVRNLGRWIPGRQNIVVTYRAGWAPALVPSWIEQLAMEVAWLVFSAPAWIGKSNRTVAGESVAYQDGLTPASQAALERLRS